MSVKIETVKIIILNNLSVIVLGPNGTRSQGEMEREGRFTRWTILVFMSTPPIPTHLQYVVVLLNYTIFKKRCISTFIYISC